MELHKKNLQTAASIGARSICFRGKRGAIVVLNDTIIGSGFSAPPRNNLGNQKCGYRFPASDKHFGDDCPCCMDAAWRAVMNALKTGKDLKDSILYIVEVDSKGDIMYAGEPHGTVTSRIALDAGISTIMLWHEDGIKAYDPKTFNDLAFSTIQVKAK